MPVETEHSDGAEVQPSTRRRASMLPPEERRSMVVEAAIPLLIEHGERVTTRQIADAAGIAEGTIFRVFADKDELIHAALAAATDPAPLDDAISALDDELPFEAALRAITELAQRRALTIWQIAASVGPRFHDTTRQNTLVSQPMVTFFKAHRDRITVPAPEAARLLRALTVALTHPALVEDPLPPKRIVDLFLNGAGAR